ncbi:MAG: TIGR00270 family protein [Nanoarchaeota archaeon]|nr:TIGR00270 family protein [Nanoarchaeota archaeon]MBU1704580.1 TIGR00270 family protein [Nanoarchaeota archaeon]
MGICDMCGKEDELYRTEIEGSVIRVCKNCARYGKVLSEVKKMSPVKLKKIQHKAEPEVVPLIVFDYAQKIKKKRQSLQMQQEEFAKQINEKVSLIHNIETGHAKPSIALARKIERFLKITLIEEYEEQQTNKKEEKSDVMTIGDLIKSKLK